MTVRIVLSFFALYLVVAQAAAHTFFVGNTEIMSNQHTNSIEVIHRFTSHDLEALLSDRHQVRVYADSEAYLKLVKAYVVENFALIGKDGKPLALEFVGIEAGINDTHIYQEVLNTTKIKGVTVKHRLLTDYFTNQKNRVNFESKDIKGSLLFDNINVSDTME